MKLRLPAVVGTALMAMGAGTFLLGTSIDTGRQVSLRASTTPVDASAVDPRDIRAHNSPKLARNPVNTRQMALANRIDTPRFGCALHVSDSGGLRWTETSITLPEGEEDKCFVPDVTFDAAGTLYVSFVTLEGFANSPKAVWLLSSGDGGRTLSAPRKILDKLAFQTDLEADAEVPGRLYLSWLQASELGPRAFATVGNPVNIVRSDDGGENWTEPVRVSPLTRTRAIAPVLVVAPAGRLHIAYLDLGEDVLDYAGTHEGKGGDPYSGTWQLVVARSADEGNTWSESVAEAQLRPTERFIAFNPPLPSVAAHGPRVYVAYPDGRDGDADVWVWASPDEGRRWDPPVRVNDKAEDDRSTQTRPAVSVGPDGRVDVVYYDRGDDPDDTLNRVSFQSSFDGGTRFTRRLLMSGRAFDSRIGSGSENGLPDLGSRLALLSDQKSAVAVWTDTRAGTLASNKQDLARAVVEFSDASGTAKLATPLEVMGVASAVAGVVMIVVGIRRRPAAG